MRDLSDIALRRWAVQTVISNAGIDAPHDTGTICRLAMELVQFVKTGIQPVELKPAGCRPH